MLVASKRHNAAKHVFGSSSRQANFEVQSCFYCSDFRLGGFAIVQLQLHGAESWTVNATHLRLSHVVHTPFTVTVSNSTQKKIMTVCTTEVSVLITSMSRVTLHSAPHLPVGSSSRYFCRLCRRAGAETCHWQWALSVC